MKKGIVFLSLAIFVFGISNFPLRTQGQTTDEATASVIQQILEQIKILQEKIIELQNKQNEVIESTKLIRQLSLGMSGEDVRQLQELLASDPEIYPEGLITGFFGPLTEKAVKKFQEKNEIDSVGRVGPQTLGKINALLTEGAGKSGKIPPGLLRAPGIAKKFPDGLPTKATTTPNDTIAPVISNLSATSTSNTVSISWETNEPAKGRVWIGTSTPVTVDNSEMKSSDSLTTNHSFSFDELATSTSYYYLVNSTDAAGNSSTSTQASISTLE